MKATPRQAQGMIPFASLRSIRENLSTNGEITFVAQDIGITSLEGLALTRSEVGPGFSVDESDEILQRATHYTTNFQFR